MSDAPPPVDARNPAGGDPAEAVIADFRAWLAAVPPAPPTPLGGTAPDAGRVDLFTLVGQFTALRHEVNLQTRAARTAVEQTAETLRLVAPPVHPDAAARPLVKALIDIADALRLGLHEVESVRAKVAARLAPPPAPAPPPAGWWARVTGRPAPPPAGTDAPDDWPARTLAGVADGYALSVRRADRALAEAEVEAVPCVGLPFDPDTMEVVAVVTTIDRPGRVVEEVRRGYRWRGALVRPAQVKVAR